MQSRMDAWFSTLARPTRDARGSDVRRRNVLRAGAFVHVCDATHRACDRAGRCLDLDIGRKPAS